MDERELIAAHGGLILDPTPEQDYPPSAWDVEPPEAAPDDQVPGQLSLFGERMLRAGLRPQLAEDWSKDPPPPREKLGWIPPTGRRRR